MIEKAPDYWSWGDPLEPLHALVDGGGLLAIPTESSYALAVDPHSERGVAAVFRLKGRESDKPLPVVMGDLDQLRGLGADPRAPQLAELALLWPAPLTVVVPIEQPLPASAGRRSMAVRIPAHPRLRRLLCQLERPLTATSANPSGSEPVSEPEELRTLLAGCSARVIDDGKLAGGRPSTIVEPEPGGLRVLREGALSISWLAARVSMPVFSAMSAEILVDDRRRCR